MKRKDISRIGKTNFLINFSQQKNGTQGFQPSNRPSHHYRIVRDIIIGIAIVLVIYLIGVGVYALDHRSNPKPKVHHAKVTRVVHHHRRANRHQRRHHHVVRHHVIKEQPQKSQKKSRDQSDANRTVVNQNSEPQVNNVRQSGAVKNNQPAASHPVTNQVAK